MFRVFVHSIHINIFIYLDRFEEEIVGAEESDIRDVRQMSRNSIERFKRSNIP